MVQHKLTLKQIALEFFSDKEGKFMCLLCYKCPAIYGTNYKNLKTHLQHNHEEELVNYCHINNFKAPQLLAKKTKQKQKLIVNNVFLTALCNSTVPFNIINDTFFLTIKQFFFQKVNIPSRTALYNLLDSKYVTLKEKVVEYLQRVGWYAFSLDIWSGNGRTVVGLKIKYCKENLDSHSHLLDIRTLKDQKADTVSHYMKELTEEFRLDKSRLIAVTTDNCPSMLLSTNIFQEYIGAFGEDEDIDLFTEEVQSDESVENPSPEDVIGVTRNSSTQFYSIGCNIHLLQLIIKHTFQDISLLNLFLKDTISVGLFFKKTAYKDDISYFSLPITIRWNSIYLFLVKMKENWKIFQQLITTSEKTDHIQSYLTEDNYSFLSKIITIFSPLYSLTKYLELSDSYLGTFYYKLIKLRTKLNDLLKNSYFATEVVNQVIMSIIKYTDFYILENSKYTELIRYTTFLIPQKQKLHSAAELKAIAYDLNIMLKDEVNDLCDPESQLDAADYSFWDLTTLMNSADNMFEESNPDHSRLDEIDKSIAEIEEQLDLDSEVSIKKEKSTCSTDEACTYCSFLTEMKSSKMFWKKYASIFPQFAKYFRVFSTAFASNGPIEQSFSLLKIFTSWHRNKTHISSIKKRLFVKEFGFLEEL